MKRKAVVKPNKKYLVIGLLAALFLSLYYLSLQKKKEGMKGKGKDKGKDKEGMKGKENKSTEEKLREKLEGFKEKLEKMQNEKEELMEENEVLQEDKKKVESKLRNVESISKIKIKNKKIR